MLELAWEDLVSEYDRMPTDQKDFALSVNVHPSNLPSALDSIRRLELGERSVGVDIADLTGKYPVVVFTGLDGLEAKFSHWNHLKPDFRGDFIFWHPHVKGVTSLLSESGASPSTYFGRTTDVIHDVVRRGNELLQGGDLREPDALHFEGKLEYIKRFITENPNPDVRTLFRARIQTSLFALADHPQAKRHFNAGFEDFISQFPESGVRVDWQPGMAAFGSNALSLHGSPKGQAQGVLLQRVCALGQAKN